MKNLPPKLGKPAHMKYLHPNFAHMKYLHPNFAHMKYLHPNFALIYKDVTNQWDVVNCINCI